MSTWYSVNLGDGMTAATPSAEIEAHFQKSFAAAGKPSDMAVFTRFDFRRPASLRCHCLFFAGCCRSGESLRSTALRKTCESRVGSVGR